MKSVALVLTERRVALAQARAWNYARLRARLRKLAGAPVEAVFYEEVDGEQLRRAGAVVLSGSSEPWETHAPAALARLGEAVEASGRPVLGICAGMQLQAVWAGGAIEPGATEHGFLPVTVHDGSDLLRGLGGEAVVFHDHSEGVTQVPDGFRVLASSADYSVQALASPERRWWGTQFHPEEFSPEHPAGERVLRSFFALVGEA